MLINPGELRNKIEIVKLTEVQGTDLVYKTTEVIYRTCFAKVVRINGTELVKSGADFTDNNIRFFIRHNGTIDTTMVIKYRGSYYNILYVNNYNDSNEYDEIWCNCKELLNG